MIIELLFFRFYYILTIFIWIFPILIISFCCYFIFTGQHQRSLRLPYFKRDNSIVLVQHGNRKWNIKNCEFLYSYFLRSILVIWTGLFCYFILFFLVIHFFWVYVINTISCESYFVLNLRRYISLLISAGCNIYNS